MSCRVKRCKLPRLLREMTASLRARLSHEAVIEMLAANKCLAE